MVTTSENVFMKTNVPKNIVDIVWLGQFEQSKPDREKFSQIVDYVVTCNPTMSERSFAAENLAAYYVQITGDSPPEEDKKRLFDWIRENYKPEDYPFYSDEWLDHIPKTYESLTDNVGEYLTPGEKVNLKGPMVIFSDSDPLMLYENYKSKNPHKVYVCLDAKIRNKQRLAQYKKDTAPGPVIPSFMEPDKVEQYLIDKYGEWKLKYSQ